MNLIRAFTIALTALAAGCATGPSPADREVLAPNGTLRVGLYSGSPTSQIKDASTGEAKGVGHDLGRELAKQLGARFEPVVFERNQQVLDAAKAKRVDLVFTNATSERAVDLDFSPTVLEVKPGFLVPAASTASTLADLDRDGLRIGVSRGSTSQAVLSREFKQAQLLAMGNLDEAAKALAAGTLDAFATNQAVLVEMRSKVPGSRIIEGRWNFERLSLGIPKGREKGMPYLSRFVEDVKKSGELERAVERAGLRGVVVVPAP